MPTLTSAAVDAFVVSTPIYAEPNPTTIPLVVVATRANKPTPDGTGIALGTTESGRIRIVTSQRELRQSYGNSIFVTSAGDPVHGDETNETTLFAVDSFLGTASRAYILRADIDLGQLLPTLSEPVLPAPDGTYWIDADSVIGGIFKLVSGTWTAQPFDVYTTEPDGDDGDDGDFAFDYSSLNGTLKFKNSGTWYAATTTNLQGVAGATNALYAQSTTPVGASNGDFWYKTNASSGGTNLRLSKYRAADNVWVQQSISRSTTAPSPIQNVVWEDLSTLATTGARPLYVGTGAEFISLEVYVQNSPPVTEPETGTLWFSDDITDFALYIEDGNLWVPITTVTVSNPTNRQKVISASEPSFPSQDAIWVDISTPEAVDNWPVIKKWNGTQWVDISETTLFSDEAEDATLVADGTYWVNVGESRTRNTVKSYNPDYTAYTVVDGEAVEEENNHWEPAAGVDSFGRKSQREVVVEALQAAISSSDEARAEDNYFQLIAVPGYPELYNEMVALNTDNKEVSFIVGDTPKFMIPSGVPVGREITAVEWITNSKNASVTGEDAFTSAPTPYASFHYPWCLATNPTDGQAVFAPPSHVVLRTIAYSDSVSAPWFPPAGPNRGRVDNAESVGYLNNNGEYQPIKLTRAQRDLLYENRINPIAFIPNVGLAVWGQKTMSATATALDRINVARLIAKMKYDLMRLLEPFLFELNDPITRRSALVVTERYLAGLKSLRALQDYAARCDESNNTPDRIDANQLWVDVAIKPARSIEFIYVPITVLGTGDEFPF